jgi:spermidine synthase
MLVPLPFMLVLTFVLPEPDISIMNSGMYNRPYGFKPGGEAGGASPTEAAHRMGRIIYQKDSWTARISVRANSPLEMSFVVNGKPDGSTSLVDMYTQIFMAHLPALVHPAAKRVLVIGLGTGTTTGCFTLYPNIKEIHVAEIEPAQVDVARIFGVHNYRAVDNSRVTIHLDDARHYLVRDDTKYDIIVSEPSNLFVSGMVNLFTREFYELVKAHLNPGGVFFQWIHYYRVGADDVKGMVATYRSVFPETTFWLHQYGDAFLLSREGGINIDYEGWQKRLSDQTLATDLRRIQLSPPMELVSFFMWGPSDLARYAGNAPLVTDDNPYLEFSTPRVRYTQTEVMRMRVKLQLWGPVEPLPLARESADRRLLLGDMFFAKGSLARAASEYGRALKLNPGSSAARARLRNLSEIERAAATEAEPAGKLEESFTE